MPLATVFPRYYDLLNELINNNFDISRSYELQTQRVWMTPSANSWDGNPFTISGSLGLPSAFDRAEINSVYSTSLKTGGFAGGGRIADTKACKMQGDYIAADERATSLRYAGRIRCAMLSSARKAGHGTFTGIFAILIKNTTDNLADGYLGV